VTGGSRFILPQATYEEILPIGWLQPHFADERGRLKMSIHALVVETPDRRIIVDTCLGNDKQNRRIPTWNNLQGPFLADLAAAGFPRESIDTVLCTHLHVDHVGWNTRLENGRWVPTFKNAKYVWSQADFDFYKQLDADPQKGPANGGSFRDSVLPVVEMGNVQMVKGGAEIEDGLKVTPAPGHTPGTIRIELESKGETALFCGDILHHAVQVYHPEWNSFACLDQDNARKSRRAAIEHCAGTGAMLLPCHFGAPFHCHIESKGAGFAPRFADNF